MAKLFKHFGIGGGVKKTGINQDGQDSLQCKAAVGVGGTNEFQRVSPHKRSSAFVTSQSPLDHHKSSVGRSTTSCVSSTDLDIRRHSDASNMNSLRRTKTSYPDWSPLHVPGRGKDSKGFSIVGMGSRRYKGGDESRFSGKASECSSRYCHRCDESRSIPERASSVTSLTLPKHGNNAADPLLRSEYCDPFDLKRETESADTTVPTSCANNGDDLTPGGAEGISSPTRVDDEYSVPYDVKMKDMKPVEPGEVSEGADFRQDSVANDSDTYADPYECSLPKTIAGKSDKLDVDVAATALSQDHSEPADQRASRDCTSTVVENSEDLKEVTADETTKPVNKSSTDSVESTEDGTLRISAEATAEAAALLTTAADEDSCRTYDEPWDLYSTRRGIENKLRQASKHWDGRSSGGSRDDDRASCCHQSRCVHSVLKGISLEGSTSSDQQEYDEPWDRKAREIERNLIVAKSAKEAARMLREPVGGSVGGGEGVPASNRNCRIDERTLEEYEARLDEMRLTASKHPGGRCEACMSHSSYTSLSTVSGGGGGSTPGQHSENHSPKRNKWNISSTSSPWSVQGERVDTTIPLEKQGWFHGSISRVEAEALLRVHREGSYLVRTSESNKSDFSLSLKSSRGFMHMKIVKRDGQLILGQFSQPFDDIPQMISFFTTNKLPIQGAEHMYLLFPVHNELL